MADGSRDDYGSLDQDYATPYPDYVTPYPDYEVDSNVSLYNVSNNATDYSKNFQVFDWGELIPVLIIYTITYVVGIIGNVLIIYTVLKFKRLRSTTNTFLLSLASADLLLVCVCIPVKLSRLFSYTWTMGLVTCKAVYYVQTVSAFCSVITLVTISLERYYAIIYPLKAQYNCTISKARKISIFIWILAIVMALPILIVQVQIEVSHGGAVVGHWCVKDYKSKYLWPLYETYIFVSLLVIPVVVMGGAYASICKAVFSMVENRKQMSNRTALGEGKKKGRDGEKEIEQVVTMLVMVVTLFILCWAPILVLNLLKSYRVTKAYSVTLKHITTTADLLSYINSCLNPIIYGFVSRHFRDSFLTAMKCGSDSRSLTLSPSVQFSTRVSTLRHRDTSIACEKQGTYRQSRNDFTVGNVGNTAV